jgi:hypothetical protein
MTETQETQRTNTTGLGRQLPTFACEETMLYETSKTYWSCRQVFPVWDTVGFLYVVITTVPHIYIIYLVLRSDTIHSFV